MISLSVKKLFEDWNEGQSVRQSVTNVRDELYVYELFFSNFFQFIMVNVELRARL